MVTKKYVEKIVKKGDSNIPIQWDLSEVEMNFAKKPDGTLAIYGCGCTGFVNEGKLVKGTYLNVIDETVSKSFVVFLDDGQPLEVKNHKGVMVRNRKGKKHVTLNFKLIVQA